MKNVAFLEQLAVNGFQLGIHGHIHEAKDEHFRYDPDGDCGLLQLELLA
ncbi:MAG: hypothetical protein HC903_17770, partial [Methylacidiphilales bacterium]|nr:hypothetical protein [Candidatus Methylacidiphilales bacterium]